MDNLSYWEKSAYKHQDYTIVGAGLVGLLTALELKKKHPKAKIAILERNTLASGASSKNAGFACFGSISEIQDDLDTLGENELLSLISLRWNGLKRLQEIVGDPAKIDLNFYGGYEIFNIEDQTSFTNYFSKLDYYNQLVKQATGLSACFRVQNQSFGFNAYEKLFFNQFEGQLNPLKLIELLRRKCIYLGISIFYGLALKSWSSEDGIALYFEDADERMFTDNLIFCTNAFTKALIEGIDLIPYRNQVLITNEIPDLSIKGTFHFNKGYSYFRNVGNRILLGGFRDKDLINEQTTEFGTTDNIQNIQENFLREVLKIEASIDHRWSGILASGSSKSAIIEKLEDNIYLAVRLGGMGVAIGSEVAHQIVKLVD